ncbi:hypothetical protein FJY93_00190 [Candidatus Kaiserbacteria bacterium]|nr:hypothetical protein [Candidatus Kaiserbacteria bacterium]
MASRKVPLVPNEYFHVYNRGVDGRSIIQDKEDLGRLLNSMRVFNRVEPVGSLYAFSFHDPQLRNQVPKLEDSKHLVSIVSFNILPNHIHFVLKPLVEKGGSEYVKRVIGGFTLFFNEKYGRTGPLFQSPFKSTHIRSTHHLLHMQTYVNLNDYIHGRGQFPEWVGASSWGMFTTKTMNDICDPIEVEAILSHFPNRSEYRKRALETADAIWQERMADEIEQTTQGRDIADQAALEKNILPQLRNQVPK